VETIAKENTMTRISTFCVLSSTLAVIALSANRASAVNITVHTPVPRVIVHVPQPKVTVHTPQLKILSNHGTVVGTKSGSNHVLLKGNLKGNSNKVGISAPTTIKLSPNSPIVGGVPIMGFQEGNPDRPIIIGSVYNATPSFSFNKIDPAGKASVVFVGQPGGASGDQPNGAGAGRGTLNLFYIITLTDVASSQFQTAHSNDAFTKVTLSFARPTFPITPQTPRIEKLNTHRVEK
jgi:hypothetical protein